MTDLTAADRLAEDRTLIESKSMPEPNSGCWLWLGTISDKGYGRVSRGNRHISAHRMSYEAFRCEIPAGLQIDHLCRVRCCVNPSHMEAVTSRENTMRGLTEPAKNASKTACYRGHKFEGDNLYINYRGERVCVTCRTIKKERRSARTAEGEKT